MNIVAKTQNSAPEETGFLCTYLADICKDISRWARIVRMLGSCEPGMEHKCLFIPHYAVDSDAGRRCMYHVSPLVNMGIDDQARGSVA